MTYTMSRFSKTILAMVTSDFATAEYDSKKKVILLTDCIGIMEHDISS